MGKLNGMASECRAEAHNCGVSSDRRVDLYSRVGHAEEPSFAIGVGLDVKGGRQDEVPRGVARSVDLSLRCKGTRAAEEGERCG